VKAGYALSEAKTADSLRFRRGSLHRSQTTKTHKIKKKP
jgi:hypothetical protein